MPDDNLAFGERWNCASCGESNNCTNEKCYACGAPRPGTQSRGGPALKVAYNQWWCNACHIPVSWGAACPKCGRTNQEVTDVARASAQYVTISGLNIPFGTLVAFLIKLALAAIPAAIVVGVLWAVGGILVTALLVGVGGR